MDIRNEEFLPGYKTERLSLLCTLVAISRLSGAEIELLKELRRDISTLDRLIGEKTELDSKIRNILVHFNLNSIQEVIETVENYRLFELCGL